MNLRKPVTCFGLLLALGFCCAAQTRDGSWMLRNVEKGFEGVNDFQAAIEADVAMERVRVPKMQATLYFKKPDKIHLTSASFVMVPREGVVINPAVLRERYSAVLLGEDTIETRRVHKLQLSAKDEKTRLRRMLLWIDPTNWTIARMETMPYQGRTVRFSFKYVLESGKFWLPSELAASFEQTVRDSTRGIELELPEAEQWRQPQRPLRSGTITLKYSDYRINVGLSDEIFERQDRPPQR